MILLIVLEFTILKRICRIIKEKQNVDILDSNFTNYKILFNWKL